MKANVKEKNVEDNSVLLEDESGNEQWFPLSERVKMQYVSIGKAEVTCDMVNLEVTYLKMDKPAAHFQKPQKPQKTFGENFTKPKPKEEEERKFYKTKHIVLEGLTGEELKTALDVASANNWVIATQTHFVDGKWYAVIYYKQPPQ